MCEANKPDNQQIIDDLTSDFSKSFVPEETEQADKSENKNSIECSQMPQNCSETNSDSLQNDVADDFIDEEKLKDLEETLSEKEKLERHETALNFKNKGNEEFKTQEYLKSLYSYTEALRICPLEFDTDRAVFYANRGAAKMQLDRKATAIEDCSKAIELNDTYVKAYIRRAKLYEETEKFDESLEDYKKILELDPGNKEATAAQIRLPPIINERNQKLTAELLDKCKSFGNVLLKPFGLSTDNFQLTKDPNSGGYSINFKQNPT